MGDAVSQTPNTLSRYLLLRARLYSDGVTSMPSTAQWIVRSVARDQKGVRTKGSMFWACERKRGIRVGKSMIVMVDRGASELTR